jgi:thioredoxin reductase (NADPH)
MKHNPIILTVDDDAEVLQAISRDIRREFGSAYRIVRVDSGTEALEVAREAKLANDVIALFLADQRMPGMSGVEFLEQAKEIFPAAKRALLTAYADTDAAIKAINDVRLDYYLMKPWDPPEDRLYPVLGDLLDDWFAQFRPEPEGIRILGHRWSSECHELRDFLARNQIPFIWIDVSLEPAALDLVKLVGDPAESLPLVILESGDVLSRPSLHEVAERIGLRRSAEVPVYDLIIVGGGPAGLAAAVYGASEGLRTCVVERHAAGGQAGMSSRIENYLGFPSGLSGDDLARRAATQAKRFGAESLLTHEAARMSATQGSVGIELDDGTEIRGHSIIVATGVAYRRLEAPGVDQFTGKGIYYGAARTEALALRGEDAFIVGGANSAGQAAVFLSEIANSVTMLVRGPSLSATMSHYLIERIENAPNIHVRYNSEVDEATGDDHLEAIGICDRSSGTREVVPAPGLFVFIGAVPPTDWLTDTLLLDDRGFILTGPDVTVADPKRWPLERDPFLLETSVPGVFAAGDVRHGSGKRVATAVGEGAMAVMSVWQYRGTIGV